LAVALIDGRIAGCVRIQSLSDEVGEFGLLAVAPPINAAPASAGS
jgi:N-acetylglutamate synthase-like GNAT family acetyltransferase